MSRATLLIRTEPRLRYEAFRSGLKSAGFALSEQTANPKRDDVLVIWNRHRWGAQAAAYERAGATVIVAENGWLNRADGTKMIALCRGHHNGAGWWPEGEADRWAQLGHNLRPWRADGGHILVLAQRGIGEPGVAMPRGWTEVVGAKLRKATRRQVVVRRHPGIDNAPDPDWTDCWAAVTWASGAAIKAIVAGVPVFYEMRKWIGGPAARYGFSDLEAPFLGDRLPMLRRLAWAQWSLEEIATGAPLAGLIGR